MNNLQDNQDNCKIFTRRDQYRNNVTQGLLNSGICKNITHKYLYRKNKDIIEFYKNPDYNPNSHKYLGTRLKCSGTYSSRTLTMEDLKETIEYIGHQYYKYNNRRRYF